MPRTPPFDPRVPGVFGQKDQPSSSTFPSFSNFNAALPDIDMAPAAKLTSQNALQDSEEEETSPPKLTMGKQRKSRLRESLAASEALVKPEGGSTDEMLQYLVNKQVLTDEWGRELAMAQDEKNTYIRNALKTNDARFDHLEELIKKQSASIDKVLQSQQSQSTKQQLFDYRPVSPKQSNNDSSVKEERFRESDIGYFDPHYPESSGKGDYIAVADKIIYRNVWLFVDSAKAIANTKGSQLVRLNLHRCLRGDAQSWYIAELDVIQRAGLHGGQGLELWKQMLTARFKMNEAEAMTLLANDKFTIEDVRQQRSVSSLAPGLQRDVAQPKRETTKLEFIQELEGLQTAWRRYYAVEAPPKKRWDTQSQQNLLPAPPSQYSQYQQPNQAYSHGKGYLNNQNFGQAPPQNSQRNYQNNRGTYSRNNQWDSQNRQGNYPANPQANQRMIEAAPPPKQASWMKPAFNSSAAPPANQQPVPVHHASQDEEDEQEAYYGQEEEEIEPQQPEPRSAMVGSYFNDTSEPKYGLAPFTCSHCPMGQSFGNADELRDHCLDYHGVDIRSAWPKRHQQDQSYRQHAKEHVYNYSPPSSHGYATVEASIFDYDLTPCLDTGGGVSLCSRSLLPNRNLYGIVHRTRPITVTGVAGQQICDEYIEQEVLLGPNKFPITMKAYLVDHLQPGLIIGMDVLNRGDIDLQLSRNMLVIGGVDVPLCYSPNESRQTSYHFSTHYTKDSTKSIKANRKWKYDTEKSMNYAPKMAVISEPIGLEAPHEKAKSEEFPTVYADLSRPGSASFFAAPSAANSACNTISHTCRRCKQGFDSGNLLHRHLTHCNRGTKYHGVARNLAAPWRKL